MTARQREALKLFGGAFEINQISIARACTYRIYPV